MTRAWTAQNLASTINPSLSESIRTVLKISSPNTAAANDAGFALDPGFESARRGLRRAKDAVIFSPAPKAKTAAELCAAGKNLAERAAVVPSAKARGSRRTETLVSRNAQNLSLGPTAAKRLRIEYWVAPLLVIQAVKDCQRFH
jgi:hypothetical protein